MFFQTYFYEPKQSVFKLTETLHKAISVKYVKLTAQTSTDNVFSPKQINKTL